MALEAKSRRAGGHQFCHHPPSFSGPGTFAVGGANAFSGRPMPRWTPPAPRWGHHLQLDLQLSLDKLHRQDLLALDLRAGQLQRFGLRWRGPPAASAAWKWPFRKTPAPIPWASTKLTIQTTTRRRLSPPRVGGRVWPGRHARPLPQRLIPADTRLERAHPQGAAGGPTTKSSVRCRPLVAVPNGFSVSANYVAASGNLGNSQ